MIWACIALSEVKYIKESTEVKLFNKSQTVNKRFYNIIEPS